MVELSVLGTTAMKPALDALGPAFEIETGHTLCCSFAPSACIATRVDGGECNDVTIVTDAGIEALIHAGRIVAGSRVDIARSRIGLSVPKGHPRPDIATLAAFKVTLVAARRVAMSHPTGGALSGAHLARVWADLGIADAMREKSIYGPGGPAGLIGNYLLRGEADIGLQQMSELKAVPGIDVIGPLPDEVQCITRFSAGVSTAATHPDGARSIIAHLRTPQAARVISGLGLEPV